MAKNVIDELYEIYNNTTAGTPAANQVMFKEMVKGLVAADLPLHETSALAASTGLATGSLFYTTAGALMIVV